MHLQEEINESELKMRQIVFLKIQIVFNGSCGPLKINSEEKIDLSKTIYSISIDDKTQQLIISAIFACETSARTISAFSTLPDEKKLCIDTEENTKIKAFFETYYLTSISAIERLYKLIRWKYSIGRDKIAYHSESLFWSLDKAKWREIVRCPPIEHLYATAYSETKFDAVMIKELLEREESEPIFFEILREANSISQQNLESGFVIAVSALEVAVKYLIKNHIPKTEWLMDEIPSPPIQRIITDYFPMLIPGFQIGKEEENKLKSIVAKRNKIVHVGKVGNDRKKLFEYLDFINEFIFNRVNAYLK
jgi:hypothetical protein